MKEFRCEKCGKLLAMENVMAGSIEIKCQGWIDGAKCRNISKLEKIKKSSTIKV